MQHSIVVDAQRIRTLKQLSVACALTTILAALLVIVGWAADISLFKSLLPGLATMKPLTALGLLLAGSALWFLREDSSAGEKRVGMLCASLVVLIGGLVVLEYIAGLSFGIDRWLFPLAVQREGGLYPGRPSAMTAISIALLGLAFLMAHARLARATLLLALLALSITLVAIIGYAYNVTALYHIQAYGSMALHTAVLCVVIASGILMTHPERSPLSTLTSDLAGGQMARRMLPAAILLPFGIGWLRLQGQLLGFYGTEFGLALFATSNIVVFGGLIYWTALALNQSDLRRQVARSALEASESQLRQIFNCISGYVGLVRADGVLIEVNDAPLVAAGLRREDVIGKPLYESHWWSYEPEAQERIRGMLRRAAAGETIRYDERVRMVGGQLVSVDLTFGPLYDADGRISQLVGSGFDITERERIAATNVQLLAQVRQYAAEQEQRVAERTAELRAALTHTELLVQSLRENEAKLQALFEVLPVGISILNRERQIVDINPALERILHITKEGLTQASHTGRAYLHPSGSPMLPNAFASVRAFDERRAVLDIETGVIIETGETIWMNVSAVPLDASAGVVVATTDITERKRAEAQMAAALHEKEVLLKEIHHRVKNNLQVISSLLRLQSEAIADPAVRELFLDSQRRVRSMALVHEQLYQSSNLSQINVGSYFRSLIGYLRRSHMQATIHIEVRVTVDDVPLTIDRAVPLGLIVSELVSNSFKHAFPTGAPDGAGVIWLSLAHVVAGDGNNANLVLTIGDNGSGLPEDVALDQTSSMGFQLVQSFVTQLRGRLTVQRRPGTVFTITIPEG